MSKKKNTLKDLDAFLKQQAATLVPPTSLRDKIDVPVPPAAVPEAVPVVTEVAPAPAAAPVAPATPTVTAPATAAPEPVNAHAIVQALSQLAHQEGSLFRGQLYDIIIRTLELQGSPLPADTMLINTALYLKSGDQWKETIRKYWEKEKR